MLLLIPSTGTEVANMPRATAQARLRTRGPQRCLGVTGTDPGSAETSGSRGHPPRVRSLAWGVLGHLLLNARP